MFIRIKCNNYIENLRNNDCKRQTRMWVRVLACSCVHSTGEYSENHRLSFGICYPITLLTWADSSSNYSPWTSGGPLRWSCLPKLKLSPYCLSLHVILPFFSRKFSNSAHPWNLWLRRKPPRHSVNILRAIDIFLLKRGGMAYACMWASAYIFMLMCICSFHLYSILWRHQAPRVCPYFPS